MNNILRKLFTKRMALVTAAYVLLVIIAVSCWMIIDNIIYRIILTGLLVGLMILIFLFQKQNEKYIRVNMEAVSKLIDSIINLRGKDIYPDTDDTMLSKLQNQLIKLSDILRKQNEEINAEKDDIKALISDISHQIKTPVATIKIYEDLLKDDHITKEETREYMNVIMTSVDKLSALTDDLIKLSRLESGIIELNKAEADMTNTVLAAILQIHPIARQKNMDIVFNDPEQVWMLRHDSKWTAEALFNIIDNAVKYSPENTNIIIDIVKYDFFLRIDIQDFGPGIPENEDAKIFNRFFRGAASSEVDGVGIGLYLSREIIENQNGYIKARSDKKGTTFSIFLPT